MRTARDFAARTPEDQNELVRNTWCDPCQEADLGMLAPVEFEEDGAIYVEGRCARCGSSVITEVVDVDLPE